MSDYWTPEGINTVQEVVVQILAKHGHPEPVSVLQIFAQAKLAPDPNALPLSTAMRMARERTEAGQETWVYATAEQGDIRACFKLAMDAEECLEWLTYDLSKHSLLRWSDRDVFFADDIESAVCRLVTPDEGTALLRGESHDSD